MSLRKLLTPLAHLYDGVTTTRNYLFDHNYLKAEQLPVPVVSVGNITAGGTGKTPFVIYLCRWLQQQGANVGVISRGYGRSSKGTVEVCTNEYQINGDEPTLIKRSVPDVPVYVSSSRFAAGAELVKKHSVDIVIADDAFQHRYLQRDFDIVLLDGTEDFKNYELLPQGLARENLHGLSRATQLVFTKMNSDGAYSEQRMKEFFRPFVSGEILNKVLCANYQLGSPVSMNVADSVEFEKSRPTCLLSAVGRPSTFEAMCRKQLKVENIEHFIFPDHHEFTAKEISKIPQGAQILVTEKDAVKLSSLIDTSRRWFYVPLTVELGGAKESFYESLGRIHI